MAISVILGRIMKKFCTFFVIFLICSFSIASAQVIEMPDPNLAAAVREALDLAPNAAITKQAVRGLARLDAGGRNINDLTGLEHATELQSLRLNDNQISDITPLADLTQLGWLRLSDN